MDRKDRENLCIACARSVDHTSTTSLFSASMRDPKNSKQVLKTSRRDARARTQASPDAARVVERESTTLSEGSDSGSFFGSIVKIVDRLARPRLAPLRSSQSRHFNWHEDSKKKRKRKCKAQTKMSAEKHCGEACSPLPRNTSLHGELTPDPRAVVDRWPLNGQGE